MKMVVFECVNINGTEFFNVHINPDAVDCVYELTGPISKIKDVGCGIKIRSGVVYYVMHHKPATVSVYLDKARYS